MITRTATARYEGMGKTGKGWMSTQSRVLDDQRYGFGTRFEDEPGTNPEELIAAAHAGCFTMALAFALAKEGLTLLTALHDVATLTACCSRGLLMAEGGIALTMEEAELRAGLADPIGFEAAMIARLRGARG